MFEDHIFTWKNGFVIPEDYNIKIADPSDLVSRHTRHRDCNSSAVENYYWALLKLFVGNTSTVCKYSHQNSKIHPLKYYTNPSVESVMLDHTDTESFIPDNTNNTIHPLTVWVNIFIWKYIHNNNKMEFMDGNIWHSWTYIAMLNITCANMDTGCSVKCSNIPDNCYCD